LYLLPNIVEMIKVQEYGNCGTCSMHGGEQRCIEILLRKLKGKSSLRRPSYIDGKIILKWLLKKDGKMRTILICLSTGASCRML
jgi:hypothetical protein